MPAPTTKRLTQVLPPSPEPPPTQKLRASANSVAGTWTDNLGGTELAAAIDEVAPDDSDFIQSVTSPVNAACRVKLASGQAPDAGTRTLRWRPGKDEGGGAIIDVKLSLRQGGGAVLGAGTLVEQFTRANVGNVKTYEETVTGAVSDYSDLYLEFEANKP